MRPLLSPDNIYAIKRKPVLLGELSSFLKNNDCFSEWIKPCLARAPDLIKQLNAKTLVETFGYCMQSSEIPEEKLSYGEANAYKQFVFNYFHFLQEQITLMQAQNMSTDFILTKLTRLNNIIDTITSLKINLVQDLASDKTQKYTSSFTTFKSRSPISTWQQIVEYLEIPVPHLIEMLTAEQTDKAIAMAATDETDLKKPNLAPEKSDSIGTDPHMFKISNLGEKDIQELLDKKVPMDIISELTGMYLWLLQTFAADKEDWLPYCTKGSKENQFLFASYYNNHIRDEGSNDSIGTGHIYNTPLHQAILTLTELPEIVHAQDLNMKPWKNTPLVLACKTGNHTAAMQLVKHHVDLHIPVDSPDKYGMTALHWACFFRDDELIKALIEAGANPELLNSECQKPYIYYHNSFEDLIVHTEEIPNDWIAENYSHLVAKESKESIFISAGFFKGHIKYCERNKSIHCLTDLIFHLDKIAFNKLNIPKHEFGKYISLQSGVTFGNFTRAYLPTLLNHRNHLQIDNEIIKMLEPSLPAPSLQRTTIT